LELHGVLGVSEQYRFLLNTVQEGIWAADTAGVTTYANPRVGILLGYAADEMIGRSVFDFFDPSDLGAAKVSFQRAIDGLTDQFELMLIRKDGTKLWAHLSSSRLLADDGKVKGVMAAITDISARESTEDAYRLLMENSTQGFAILQEGRVLFCNRVLASISGYSSDELQRMSPQEVNAVVYPDDQSRVLSVMKDRLEGKEIGPTAQFRFIQKGGAIRWVETSSMRTSFNGATALLVTYTDVTQRHEAEAALRESETKLRSLIEQNLLGITLVDQDGRIAEWNSRMAEITGMPRSSVHGQPLEILRVLMTEGPTLLENAFSTLAQSYQGSAVDLSIAQFSGPHKARIRLPGGEEKSLRVEMFPIHLPTGFMLGALAEEVTEQERIEDAYRSLVDNSVLGFGVIQDGRIVFCNEALGWMSGFTRDETYRMTAEEVAATIHPEDRWRVSIAMQSLLDGGDPPPARQIRMLSRDGRVRWVEVLAARTIYNFRPAVQISYMDVSERREAEAALRQSEGRFRALIEKAPFAIRVGRAGKTLYGNAAFIRMFGIQSLQDLVGRPLTDQVAPNCRKEVKDRTRRQPATDEFDMTAMRQDGLQFPCRVAETSLLLSDGPAEMAFFTDFTAQKDSEKKLEDSRSKLRNLALHLLHAREEERKKVAREIHDELGQMLTALKMDLRWIEKRLGLSSPQVTEKIRGVVELADSTIQTVHRISSELRPGVLDDIGLTAALEWLGGDFSRRSGILCRVDVTAPESRIGGNSSTALFRIIQEALTNVARHSRASRVSVEFWEADGMLEIQVQDDGIGITEEQSTSPLSFGLIGIRERAQGLHGEVSITGMPGKGTTLTVTIPLPQGGALA
jgi:PAS domain S-box-containing protein